MSVAEGQDDRPDPVFIRQRWITGATVAWARQANEILGEHGVVIGTTVYKERHQARWRARRLIRLLTDDLRLRERWQLREHTELKQGGWVWSIEYRGGSHG